MPARIEPDGIQTPVEVGHLPPFKTPKPTGMSDQIATFCRWYAVVPNGALAYTKAGFSPRGANRQAYKVRRREPVRAYIAALQHELASGETVGTVTREWVTDRYRAMAEVKGTDYVTDDGQGSTRWKRPDELTEVQRAAVREVRLTRIKPVMREGVELEPERLVICGYDLHATGDALLALRQLQGFDAAHTVKVDHQHQHSHKVAGLFRFVAGREGRSETVARLRARHGNAGARVIEHDPGPERADPRALRQLKGV
jgi:hypothetical protein